MSDLREYFLGGIRTKRSTKHVEESLLGSYDRLFRDDFGEVESIQPYVILLDEEGIPGDIVEPDPVEDHTISEHIDKYISEEGNINTFDINEFVL